VSCAGLCGQRTLGLESFIRKAAALSNYGGAEAAQVEWHHRLRFLTMACPRWQPYFS
jgi:hypothetical protein